jgi:hypothetical protein
MTMAYLANQSNTIVGGCPKRRRRPHTHVYTSLHAAPRGLLDKVIIISDGPELKPKEK